MQLDQMLNRVMPVAITNPICHSVATVAQCDRITCDSFLTTYGKRGALSSFECQHESRIDRIDVASLLHSRGNITVCMAGPMVVDSSTLCGYRRGSALCNRATKLSSSVFVLLLR